MRRRAPCLEKDRASITHSILPDQFTLSPKTTRGGETINDDGLSKKAIWSMQKSHPLECVKQWWAIFCFSQFLHFCQIRWNFFPQQNSSFEISCWIFGEISPYHQSLYPYKNVIMPCVRNFVLKAAKSWSKIFRKPMSLATNLLRLVVEGFLLPVIGCLGLVSLFRFDS